MNVLFVVLDDEERASTRYRVLNFLPHLEEAGIDYDVVSIRDVRGEIFSSAHVTNVVSVLRTLLTAPFYDAVFVQKLLPPTIFTRLLGALSQDLVYDIDDALYASPKREEDGDWTAQLNTMLRTASVVVSGGQIIADYAEQYADRVEIIGPSLPKEEYTGYDREDGDEVVLGWIGNPENIRYLENVESVIGDVLDDYPSARLDIITSADPPATPLKERDDVAYRTWSLEKETDYLARTDIGIRPLIDDEWTRAKGGFLSVLQHLALGRPVVVTPVGELASIVQDGEWGYHATAPEDWHTHLSELIEDPETRREMGEKARESIEERGYWTHQRAEELIDLLQRVANGQV